MVRDNIIQEKDVKDSILQMELVNALGSNNIDSVLAAIFKLDANTTKIPVYGSPLHLVITLCDKDVVKQVLDVFCREGTAATLDGHTLGWINQRNMTDGETPLHIACKLSRHEIVELLLEFPTIDDTIRDLRGRIPEDLAKTDQMADLFAQHKTQFIEAFFVKLKCILKNGEIDALEFYELFSRNQRTISYIAFGWIDINSPIEMETERSLLHLIASREDLELVDFLLKQGADPNVKDIKCNIPADLAKSEKVKNRLKNASTIALIAPVETMPFYKEAPSLKGTLLKWTNYTMGYKPRYFVLEDGALSYYQDVADYPIACRGSISSLTATATFPDSNDKCRFDVMGSGNVRYSLKARSPADAKKWVWCLMESQRWMKDKKRKSQKENSRESIDFKLPVLDSLDPTKKDNEVDQKNTDNNLKPPLDPISNSVPSSAWDMPKLLYLLRIQIQSQRDIVTNVISSLQQENCNLSNELLQLPSLLSHSCSLVQATSNRLLETYDTREQFWVKRLKKETDARKRLEDVMQKFAGVKSNTYGSSSDMKNSIKSTKTLRSALSEDDVFYDIDDEVTMESFVESAFGFERLPEDFQINSSPLIRKKESLQVFCTKNSIELVSKGYTSTPRITLPIDGTETKPSLAIWSFLKSAVGKELSKITLPVTFNEPLSMLQRMCEDIEYVELLSLAKSAGTGLVHDFALAPLNNLKLDKAVIESLRGEDACLFRMLMVAAFAMSNYSSTPGRINKPFNPLLGETFELVDPVKGFKYVSEQVCHHPPISACFCESPDYTYWTEVNVKSKFGGRTLEFYPLGNCRVSIPLDNGEQEQYSWKKITTCVNNIIFGPLFLDHFGDMIIKNHSTGQECILTFKKKESGGWFSGSSAHSEEINIIGVVKDSKGVARYNIKGNWKSSLTAIPIGNSPFKNQFTIWKRNNLPQNSADNFNFTHFAITLNQLSPELKKRLPLTDSRLRPDQRELELGHWEKANFEKDKLENFQRKTRQAILEQYSKTGKPSGPIPKGISIGEDWWVPRWFHREFDKETNEETWEFNREYWKIRSSEGEWPDFVLNIFGL